MEPKSFGQMFKELRLKNQYTLRGFCKAFGKDAGNVSRMERDISPPPQDREQLTAYAEAFKLKPGSEEYDRFFALAAIGAGKIPANVLSDEDLVARLPALFRTVTGQKIDGDKLDEFIEFIRNS